MEMRIHNLRTMNKMRARVQANCGESTRETDKVIARIGVGVHPSHVVISPDSLYAYVTNGGDGSVSVVDLQSKKTVATIKARNYPHGIRISPDGKQAYVVNLKGGTVSVIDTASRTQQSTIQVGKGPAQVGFTPDGQLAFVSLSGENQVALLDPMKRKIIKKIKVGTVPIQVYATPDNKTLLVANQGSKDKPGNTVTLIDLPTQMVRTSIQTGAGAHGIVVDTQGRYAYVSNTYANTISAIDLQAGKPVATIPVGMAPNGISIVP